MIPKRGRFYDKKLVGVDFHRQPGPKISVVWVGVPELAEISMSKSACTKWMTNYKEFMSSAWVWHRVGKITVVPSYFEILKIKIWHLLSVRQHNSFATAVFYLQHDNTHLWQSLLSLPHSSQHTSSHRMSLFHHYIASTSHYLIHYSLSLHYSKNEVKHYRYTTFNASNTTLCKPR